MADRALARVGGGSGKGARACAEKDVRALQGVTSRDRARAYAFAIMHEASRLYNNEYSRAHVNIPLIDTAAMSTVIHITNMVDFFFPVNFSAPKKSSESCMRLVAVGA